MSFSMICIRYHFSSTPLHFICVCLVFQSNTQMVWSSISDQHNQLETRCLFFVFLIFAIHLAIIRKGVMIMRVSILLWFFEIAHKFETNNDRSGKSIRKAIEKMCARTTEVHDIDCYRRISHLSCMSLALAQRDVPYIHGVVSLFCSLYSWNCTLHSHGSLY